MGGDVRPLAVKYQSQQEHVDFKRQDAHLMVSVISSQVGGEWYQGYEHEAQNVVPDESSVRPFDVPKMLLMGIPEGAQGEERQRVDQELRNEPDEMLEKSLVGFVSGYALRHIDSQNQQGHGEGEDSIG